MTSLMNPYVVQTADHQGLVYDLLTELYIQVERLRIQEQPFFVNRIDEISSLLDFQGGLYK